MAITITKTGMPNRSMTVERDTAEAILDALAIALGASVIFDCQPPEDHVEVGTIIIDTTD